MAGPVPTTQLVSREELGRALERLQERGLWSAEQSAALLAELEPRAVPAGQAGVPAGAAPSPVPPPRPAVSSRLAEAAAYAGAILVAAAGAVLVGQQWEHLTRLSRIAILGGLTAVLGIAGCVVALVAPRGRRVLLEPAHAVRRRLASTALTAAAATGAGTAAQLVEGHALLAAGVAEVLIMGLALALAPSAVSEIGSLGALAMFVGGAYSEMSEPPMWALVVTLAAVGLGWAALSWTPVLTVPTLGLVLGLAMAVWSGASAAFGGEGVDRTVGLIVLGVLAAGGLGLYVRIGRWPLAAAAVASLALLVLQIGSDRLGPVLALLLTGVVLLAGGALVLLRRRPR